MHLTLIYDSKQFNLIEKLSSLKVTLEDEFEATSHEKGAVQINLALKWGMKRTS